LQTDGFGCAVVREGDLARSARNGVKRSDPSRRDRMIVQEPLSTPARNLAHAKTIFVDQRANT
jgi:hypothetical protein